MTIIQKEYFSIKQCNKNPKNLYVFGDNSNRIGRGGQAIIRNCSNSFGIVTKLLPSTNDKAYFNDDKFVMHLFYIEADINRLKEESKNYDNIVFPKAGLGTGLSDMPNKCPKLFKAMNELLKTNFGFDNVNGVKYEKR